jgi:hypothetical protein
MTLRYVQSKDGVFVRHINDIEPTQWDENNFCFARKLTPEQALHFGVTKLKIVTPPYFDPATQRRDEGPAVLTDGVWVQQYVVTELNAEEAAVKAQAQGAQVRAERNAKLAASDWTQVEDSPVDHAAWAAYRQQLRDITAQAGFPWTVQWPTQPE